MAEDDIELASEGQDWQDTLSYGEKAKLNLARALIMNPEVLVLQRPLSHYDSESGALMMGAIVEHVRNRGYCLPEITRPRRRPRTLFISPSTQGELRQADTIWEVTQTRSGGAVTTIGYEDIRVDDYVRLHLTSSN
eukprot:gnl/TRDRNA2_/TRDRNA2_162675_c4_seq1.p1 gnl/TRDRNA2_/TRDRNA2_162675_c4~~gnl/TRDRNA2_/TRDRNA2_162675_c4_seq1.p1  ORF type:complete len:156 (-),score=12.73 gnl/TRDRNA2_/TRDRNA2_162675_c4_seq1:98-505(-)